MRPTGADCGRRVPNHVPRRNERRCVFEELAPSCHHSEHGGVCDMSEERSALACFSGARCRLSRAALKWLLFASDRN